MTAPSAAELHAAADTLRGLAAGWKSPNPGAVKFCADELDREADVIEINEAVPLLNRLAQWITARQVSVRAAFAVMFFVGVIYAVAGLLFSDTATDFILGIIVTGVGAIGFDCVEWCSR